MHARLPWKDTRLGRKHSYRLYRCTVRMTLARCCLALFVHEPPRPPRTLAAARRIRSWLAALVLSGYFGAAYRVAFRHGPQNTLPAR